MYAILIPTTDESYDSINQEQEAAFKNLYGSSNYMPRLSIDGTEAILRVFGSNPNSYKESFDTPEILRDYINTNATSWIEDID